MDNGFSEFRAGWKVVLASAIGVGAGVTGVAFYTAGLFLKPLITEFHWSRAAVSAATLCLHFGWAVMAPFIGRLSDRFDVRKIALISVVGVVLGFLALTQVNANIWTLYVGLVFLGMAGSGTAPGTWARAVSSWFDRSRGLALGITLAGTGVAGLVAPKAVDGLIQAYGWRGGYVGLAIFVAVVAFPIVFLFFRERTVVSFVGADRPAALTGVTRGEALRSIRFWQMMVGILLIAGIIAAMLVHLVPLLTDSGMSRGEATGIASLVGFAIVVSRIATGRLVDRFHGPYVAGITLSVPTIGYLLIAAHPGGGWELILAALTIGVAAGAEIDLLAFLTSRFFGLKQFGGIYGLLLVAFAVGAGISPILMGRVYDVTGSYQDGLYVGAACCAIGALLFGTLGRYPRAFAPTE
jgi:MFS family permease